MHVLKLVQLAQLMLHVDRLQVFGLERMYPSEHSQTNDSIVASYGLRYQAVHVWFRLHVELAVQFWVLVSIRDIGT